MSNLIQIKRSNSSAAPSFLANGELAFTSAGDVLWIGSAPFQGSGTRNPIAIAGRRFPGILTANQALVANSTQYMDQIKVVDLYVTNFHMNDGGGAATDLVANNLTIYSNTNIGYELFVGNNLSVNNSLTVQNDITSLYGNLYATNGSLSIKNILANNAAGLLGQVITSDGAGTTYWQDIASLAYDPRLISNTDSRVLSGNLTFTAANTVVDNLQVINTAVLGTGLNDSIIQILGAIDSDLTPYANNTFTLGGANRRWQGVYAGNVYTDVIKFNTGASIVGGGQNTISVGGLAVTNLATANYMSVYHDLTVGGDLYLSGNIHYANVVTYAVEDPLIHLGTNNHYTDTLDIGFYGDYFGPSYTGAGDDQIRYTGLVRDASTKDYVLFAGLTDQPIQYVNTASASFQYGMLHSYLSAGGFTSNSTDIYIRNYDTGTGTSYNVTITANTLTLSNPLEVASGGTSIGDYGANGTILVFHGTSVTQYHANNLNSGQLLQSTGTSFTLSGIDGGTF